MTINTGVSLLLVPAGGRLLLLNSQGRATLLDSRGSKQWSAAGYSGEKGKCFEITA